MIIKQIIDEDFINYKKPSMFICFPKCSWKCEKECGVRVCQNNTLALSPDINIITDDVCVRYLTNQLTSAIVCGGLEPMDSFDDLIKLICIFRITYKCYDDIVIYTGYTEEECINNRWIGELNKYTNIIIKFGRFIPGNTPHYDNVIGVKLASDNQYAKIIC